MILKMERISKAYKNSISESIIGQMSVKNRRKAYEA
jgi:hypothetical protein